jgi:hypothetical protein
VRRHFERGVKVKAKAVVNKTPRKSLRRKFVAGGSITFISTRCREFPAWLRVVKPIVLPTLLPIVLLVHDHVSVSMLSCSRAAKPQHRRASSGSFHINP